jgi:hypothetical protein
MRRYLAVSLTVRRLCMVGKSPIHGKMGKTFRSE